MVGDLNRHCTKMHGFIHSVPRKKSNNKKNKCDICKAETSETLASHKMVQSFKLSNLFIYLLTTLVLK